MRFKFFLLACLWYICSTRAIAIIPQLSLVNETAISNGLANPSSLSLSAPETPADFRALLIFDKTQQLNAFNLWRPALTAMYALAPRGWDNVLQSHQWVLAVEGSDVGAIVTAEEFTVKVGYVIIALYNAVNAMFQLQPGFFKCSTDFILQGRKIGGMEILSLTSSNSGHASASNIAVNSTTSTVPQVDIRIVNKDGGNNTLAGTARDDDDPRLTIGFEYQRVVPRQDLWTSVLDGMATTAQYDAGARCNFVTAVSISGNLAFHINEVSNHLLTYNVAMKTFRLVALISMSSKEYKEQDIRVFFDGLQIAEGYVLRLSNTALGGGSEPVSNER